MKNSLVAIAAFFILSLNGYSTVFTTPSFLGTVDWNACATWGTCPGSVEGVDWPGTGDNANISVGTSVTVTANQTCYFLDINADDSFEPGLIVNSGTVLTIENEWQIDSDVNDGGFAIEIHGTVNVADDLDINITHTGFSGVFEIFSTGTLNLNEPTVPNTVIITGTSTDLQFVVNGPLTVLDRLIFRATSAANLTIDVNANFTMSNDDLQIETQGTGSTLTMDLDATLTCPDRLIIKSNTDAGGASVRLDMVTGGSVKLDGLLDFSVGGGGTVDASTTASTFEYSGSLAQTVQMGATIEYNNLVFSGTGTKTLEAAITTTNVLGDLTIQAGTFTSNAFDITLGGNWSNSGTFTQGTAKVIMAGGAAQTIGGSTTTQFYNLEIANTVGGVSLTGNVDLQDSLELTTGVFTTSGQTFRLLSNATRTAE